LIIMAGLDDEAAAEIEVAAFDFGRGGGTAAFLSGSLQRPRM
jgi:hypothetical protein